MDFDPLKQPPIHMAIVYGPIPSWKKPKKSEKGNTSEDELIPMCKICQSLIVVSIIKAWIFVIFSGTLSYFFHFR